MRHRGRRALLPLGRAHRTGPGRRRAGLSGRLAWRRGAALALLLALGTSVGLTSVVVTAGEVGRRLAEFTREGASDVSGRRVTPQPSRSSQGATGRAVPAGDAARRLDLRRTEQPSPATYGASTTAPSVPTQTEQPTASTDEVAGDSSTPSSDPESPQATHEAPQEDDAAEQPSTSTPEPEPDGDGTSSPGEGEGSDGEPPSQDPDDGERPGNGQGQGAGGRPSG